MPQKIYTYYDHNKFLWFFLYIYYHSLWLFKFHQFKDDNMFRKNLHEIAADIRDIKQAFAWMSGWKP